MKTQLIKELDKKLLPTPVNFPSGLASGKMGLCIYFYMQGKLNADQEYTSHAEKLLDEIYAGIQKVQGISIKDGLAGIAMGIAYLIENGYIKGDVNTVLEDIDDLIFKKLSYPKYLEELSIQELIPLLYYLYTRTLQQPEKSTGRTLLQDLIISLINLIYAKIDLSFFEEPITFRLDYSLPQLLFVFGKICRLDFYNGKILKITELLSSKIYSFQPLMHSNRLYLYGGMKRMSPYIPDPLWDQYANQLGSVIDYTRIMENEFGSKSIFLEDGYAGLAFVVRLVEKELPAESAVFLKEQLLQKINNSGMWESLMDKPNYFRRYSGLYNGFCGTSLMLEYLKGGTI